jgi:hypothetical protein
MMPRHSLMRRWSVRSWPTVMAAFSERRRSRSSFAVRCGPVRPRATSRREARPLSAVFSRAPMLAGFGPLR